MKTLSRCLASLAICLTCLVTPIAIAQSEKVSVKMVPEPNQTVRVKVVQEMEIEMTFEGDTTGANALSGPMKMLVKNAFSMTQKVGEQDKQGAIISEITYDKVHSEISMNGQSLPIAETENNFIGKKIMATFDKQRALVDLKIPSDLGIPEETLKQMLKSVYANLPQTLIGVGESATSPLDFTVPVPLPGAPPLKMDGSVKFKLVSIDRDATGRIARFDQAVDGKIYNDIEIPSPDGKVKMSVDFKMNGTGDIAVNVDRGFVKTGDSKATFGGKIKMTNEAGEAKMPAINLTGVLKETITGVN